MNQKIRRFSVVLALLLALLLAACSPNTPAEDLQTPPVEEGATPGFDDQADLVVVGAGAAGIAAAVEAADSGCEDIILLEKTAILGGTAILSEGILSGYDTQLSQKHGAQRDRAGMLRPHDGDLRRADRP